MLRPSNGSFVFHAQALKDVLSTCKADLDRDSCVADQNVKRDTEAPLCLLVMGVVIWRNAPPCCHRRRRERLEKENRDIKSVMEMRTTELKARAAQVESADKKLEGLGDTFKSQRHRTEKTVCNLPAFSPFLTQPHQDAVSLPPDRYVNSTI